MAWPKGKPRPKGAGRKKGTPNKVTADIKLLAKKHGPSAIANLVELMDHENPQTRVAACKELLDRGYGKAAQPHTGEQGGDITIRIVE